MGRALAGSDDENGLSISRLTMLLREATESEVT